MSENIKEAIKYGVELYQGQKVIYEQDGKTYYDRNEANLVELEPIKRAEPLKVSTLSGLARYLKKAMHEDEAYEADPLLDGEERELTIVNVESPTTVRTYTTLDADRRRETLIEAKAVLDTFPFGQFVDSEQFIIKIQSFFQRTPEAETIIKLASGIKIGSEADLRDNGVSQTVTVREGANVEVVEVPNPIDLQPFRTFLEVEQPRSAFVFRIDKQGRCALFEADGGIWKNEAMENVKEYLEGSLIDLIEAEVLTIIA